MSRSILDVAAAALLLVISGAVVALATKIRRRRRLALTLGIREPEIPLYLALLGLLLMTVIFDAYMVATRLGWLP